MIKFTINIVNSRRVAKYWNIRRITLSVIAIGFTIARVIVGIPWLPTKPLVPVIVIVNDQRGRGAI